MNRSRAALSLVVPLVLLAGCGSGTSQAVPSDAPPAAVTGTVPPRDDSPSRAPAGSPPASASPAGSDPSAATRLKPPTSTKGVEVERSPDAPPLVTGVRFARHRGFDRVVVDFKGSLPGYRVEWVPELVQDGSGEPIDVTGGAYLQVTITPANAHTESGKPTWTGGPIFQADLGNVRNVVRTGDFEAVVGVGIVLDRKAGFRVLEQKQPNRLVIDVAN
ncbi:hypothetical protein GCM10010156_45970 [Planobispora rosea]|uniref:AMIN-like domain-containing protein n=1 Tax=Planobispora rosea TaxID=35762 RepID=A0A8J3S3D1_PLARO|nr:hypothetical protein [Planobispora rosea]GGS82041.1 hypothetical protein GCM10010156_45970 [Planobispora rosea]GIH86070.1 hypothetical protein Pro02_44780 [Planobispora rosea]